MLHNDHNLYLSPNVYGAISSSNVAGRILEGGDHKTIWNVEAITALKLKLLTFRDMVRCNLVDGFIQNIATCLPYYMALRSRRPDIYETSRKTWREGALEVKLSLYLTN
jgi:hypothetical protein